MATITMAHGGGGTTAQKLIQKIFFKYFHNELLNKADDSAVINMPGQKLCFTTDSFIVQPIFFPGGDIGKLSVCGTVNDLAVNGAKPCYLSCGFILAEGFPIHDLEKIVRSMADCAQQAGVQIVTGDTKVMEQNALDSIIINTSGIGVLPAHKPLLDIVRIKPGDRIILSGNMGDHGMAVLSKRKGLEFSSQIRSDCAPLGNIIQDLLIHVNNIKFMRDPTRGGVATVLNEIAQTGNLGITIEESKLPVADDVQAACELLGFDPLYIANEGKVLIFVDRDQAEEAVNILKKYPESKNAVIIGEVTRTNSQVILKTKYGASRIINMLSHDQLPRIC